MGYALKGKEVDKTKYKNPDNDPRGDWMSSSIDGLADAHARPNLHFTIINVETRKQYTPSPDTGWRYQKSTIEKYINENRIIWPKNDTSKPRIKRYIEERKTNYTGFSSILETVFTVQGTRKLREIMGKETLKFPKPSELIKVLITQCSDKNATILDSFAGSGTTAHAVLALNKEDGGNRKFILIECEDYADSITAERVRRVIKGVPNAKDETLKNGLGGSFTYVKLGDPIDHEMMLTGESLPTYEQLARHVFWTATNETFTDAFTKRDDGFIGESARYCIYLIYKPDIAFLGSNDATLSLNKVKEIRQKAGGKKRLLVFAPVSFMSKEDLEEYRVTFCQLPWAINDRPLQREK